MDRDDETQARMEAVPIRLAKPADASAVLRIVERAYRRYLPRLGRRPPPMDYDYVERIRGGRVLVAGSDEIFGAMALVPEADQLLIESLVVAPEHQGKGIGGALVAHAESAARTQGLRRVWLFTHVKMVENQAIYRRLGFKECGREGSGETVRVLFERPLTG
jgi:ribosomal protein S18 acetylase RimI-like enzyme